MVHDGCSGTFADGKMIADKVRQMGFNLMHMPVPFDIKCENCGNTFEMDCFESHCPHCDMVYAVTPCHAYDPSHIMAAGVSY